MCIRDRGVGQRWGSASACVPSSQACACTWSRPRACVSLIASRATMRASVGIVAWYMKPPAS
eukprot:2821118-Prymnesium_polylepis.1